MRTTEIEKLYAAAGHSFDDAMHYCSPMMQDVAIGKPSKGEILLAMWAQDNLTWANVEASKNETSIARIKKDASAERGRRLCVRGTIMEIARVYGNVFSGVLRTAADPDRAQDLVHFKVVGATGDLVDLSQARLCGVAIGRQSYTSAAGLEVDGVGVVGMFDLPANRARR